MRPWHEIDAQTVKQQLGIFFGWCHVTKVGRASQYIRFMEKLTTCTIILYQTCISVTRLEYNITILGQCDFN